MPDFVLGMLVGACVTCVFMTLTAFLSTMFPWKRAVLSGCDVSLLSIVMTRLRGVPPAFLVDACVALRHSGHKFTYQQIESCYLAHKHEIHEHDMDGFIILVKDRLAEQPTSA